MLEGFVEYVIGVDTHKHTHTAAVLAAVTGAVLDTVTVTVSTGGYEELVELADTHCSATERAWSIEGTGSYGAGLCSFLQARGELVHELARPARPARRDGAKDDELDAVRAARELLVADRVTTPRAGGHREAMRILVATRQGAVRDRTRAINQLKALIVSAPEPLRERLRGLDGAGLIGRCRRLRHSANADPAQTAALDCLRRLATRIGHLDSEITQHDRDLVALTKSHCPQLLAEAGVGHVIAAQTYISWSHQGRCRNESAFASLAGVAPIPASSGQTIRYRLNRGGDRQLNRALHTVALTRARQDPTTRAYIQRRLAEGKTPREARRCLKRYLARHFYRLLENPPLDT